MRLVDGATHLQDWTIIPLDPKWTYVPWCRRKYWRRKTKIADRSCIVRLLAALALITLSLGCGRANPLVDDDIEGAHASLTKGTGGANNGDSDYCGYTVSTVCADGEGDCVCHFIA